MSTIDLQRPAVPLGRLVAVELRKMIDTRAGFWLLAVIGLIDLLIMLAMVLWVDKEFLDFSTFLAAMALPMNLLLPVLGVLSITQEWGQRTALVSFTLVPRRARVIVSKLLAVVVLALVSLVVAMVLAAIGAVLGGGDDVWSMETRDLVAWPVLQVIGLIHGFAFGMLLLSSALAIVVYVVYLFLVPTVFQVLSGVTDWGDGLQRWFDFGTLQGQVFNDPQPDNIWLRLLVSGLVWLGIPFAVGLWRVLRSEVK